VRLSDFYKSNVHHGNSQFAESLDYLRQLGALDESDPTNPRVMIPNYLSMDANCIHVSGYYDLCCADKCSHLMGLLENQIRAPSATPSDILQIVSANLPTNRTLPRKLAAKLEDVASHHGGEIPLHGRLFAQWMHFAYPRECPYPHVSGTTRPMSDLEFHVETGSSPRFSKSEMKNYIEATEAMQPPKDTSADSQVDPNDLCISSMWDHVEELVDATSWNATLTSARPLVGQSARMPPRAVAEATDNSAFSPAVVLRACACLVVLASSATILVGFSQQALAKVGILSEKTSSDSTSEFGPRPLHAAW